jgi:DNA-binding NtrC family response regulator
MNVLIVEPDGAVAARRIAAFGKAGHVALATTCPDKALSLLRRRSFDLMLVDPFREECPNLSILVASRVSAPFCRIVLLTASTLFVAGELFSILPTSIDILRAPIPDRDLVIYCEETRMRLSA